MSSMGSGGGKQAPHSGYDQRAVAVLEEAMALGAVPLVKLEGDATIDMRSLPPNVAEVYVLAVMGQMQRRRDPRRVLHPGLKLIAEVPGSRVHLARGDGPIAAETALASISLAHIRYFRLRHSFSLSASPVTK